MRYLIVTPDDIGSRSYIPLFYAYDLITKALIAVGPDILSLGKTHNKNGICIQQELNDLRPFGITECGENFLIASNTTLYKFNKKDFSLIEEVPIQMFIDTHQIECVNDTLYVANTGNDTIGIHNKEGSVFFCARTKSIIDEPPYSISTYQHNQLHLNSIKYNPENNSLYYCLNNNRNKDSDSEFWKLDLETYEAEFIFSGGKHAHNIDFFQNNIFTLSSKTGELLVYDVEKETKSFGSIVDPNKLFLKGMRKIDDNVMTMGVSCHKKAPQTLNSCAILSLDLRFSQLELLFEIKDCFRISDYIIF